MQLDRDPQASARRVVTRAAVLLLPVVAGALAAPFLMTHLGWRAPPEPERRDRPPTVEELHASARASGEAAAVERDLWENAAQLAPRDVRADARGELVRPFHGFGLSVASEPPGARVIVDGQELGETPLVTSVHCAPGAEVQVRVEKSPLPPALHQTTCRVDTLVELGSLRLRR
jgi:hypothetical protein